MRPLVAAVLLVTAAQAQVPFRARGETVRVDVLVSDRGRPVPGLTRADFKVRDNGVEQQVDFVGFDEVPINLVLVFDVSDSLTGERMRDLRAASHAAIDQLKADDRGAVVPFTQAVKLGGELTRDFGQLRQALSAQPPDGQTSLVDASFAGLMAGHSDTGRTLMLVFSDGLDVASWLQPAFVIDAAGRSDAVVFGVSAGRLKARFLKDLAETTGGDVFEVRSTSELRETFVRLISEYRQRYLVSYTPKGVETAGWHRLDVSVTKGGARVKARPGYQRGK